MNAIATHSRPTRRVAAPTSLLLLVLGLVLASCRGGEDQPTPPSLRCPNPNVVVTTAGTGTAGLVNGQAFDARFSRPRFMVTGPDGALYVADSGNHCVRRIFNGQVTTFAGTGVAGYVDGAGASAQFDGLSGIAITSDGTLYVSERAGGRIRRITAAGAVSTFAGGTVGFADGVGSAAQFDSPEGLVFGADGQLYVADRRNHRIRRISANGTVSTVAGSGPTGTDVGAHADGPASTARFSGPVGLAASRDGNIFITDAGNYRVRALTVAGQVSTVTGSGARGSANGAPGTAQFTRLGGIAIAVDGALLVTDGPLHRIRRIAADGTVSNYAGSGTSGFINDNLTVTQLNDPFGLALGLDGVIHISELGNHAIRRLDCQ